mmetsp:Transcript_21011/g.46644  ORF Transcript_21011/g.46644 Transcript_21011/m.46644 type:complete len:275 (-) Transcript_21011:773-1597(-)
MSSLKPASKNKLPHWKNNRKGWCPMPSQNGIVCVPNVDVIHLQRTVMDNTEILGKFMYFDWQKQGLYHTLDQKTNMSIDKFQEIDSGRKRHVIAYDNQTPKLCLFAKISRENVSRKLSGRRPVERLRFFGTEMSRCVQNVKRGKQHSSEDSGCFFIGERANRSVPGTGEYQCKPNISNDEMKSLRSLATHIVRDMEEASRAVSRHLKFEESLACQIRKDMKLKTVGTYATAFAMGISYQSKCHTDKDYYYSLLSVTAPRKKYDTEIIQWFVFPG